MLDPAIALADGFPTKVVNAANAIGTGLSHNFSVKSSKGKQPKVQLQAQGTFTVFNGNIEVSSNGGTNYNTLSAFDFVADSNIVIDVLAGLLYRVNISNLTQTVPPDVYATCS